jgi:hypothetical protein
MIRPIQAVTDGLLFARSPLSIAVRGLLAAAGALPTVLEYHGGGMSGGAWDELEYERIRRKILREDEEMLEIIIQAILSGVFD